MDAAGTPALALWVMGDDRLSEHPEPVEFLNIYLGDNLQPHPGVPPTETCSCPDLPEPFREQTGASDPSDSTGKRDAPPTGSSAEPGGLGSGSSQESPRQSHSTSTQVVFWAGILQAQMCVLDLEEELEKTEGLRAELRSCIPTAPADLAPFSSGPASPLDSGLHPSPPLEEASGEDSSRPEGENQVPASPGEGTPGSSPEWGAEEESLFFDNPLFLESPCSDTSAPGVRFTWGYADSCADVRPESPQTLEPPHTDRVPWGLGDEPDCGGGLADSSGCITPPFPVPTYKPHSLSWTALDTMDQAPTAPPGWGQSEVSWALGTDPELCMGTQDRPCSVVTGPRTRFRCQGLWGPWSSRTGRTSVSCRIMGNSTDAMCTECDRHDILDISIPAPRGSGHPRELAPLQLQTVPRHSQAAPPPSDTLLAVARVSCRM